MEKDENLKDLSTAATYPSDLSQLQFVRDFVKASCDQTDTPAEFIQELQLAINEVFCNISQHGYQGNTEGLIEIRVEPQKDGMILDIFDQGQTFNPRQIEKPSFLGDKTHGFGWYLINLIADRISYIQKKRMDGWNHLRLFKHYHRAGKEMDIIEQIEKGILILTPQISSLDAKDSPEFKRKISGSIQSHEAKNVILDLHHLHFVDSSGLGIFLTIMRELHAEGGELKLSRMNKPIRTMFELVSMHKIFQIYHSNEEALRSFS